MQNHSLGKGGRRVNPRTNFGAACYLAASLEPCSAAVRRAAEDGQPADARMPTRSIPHRDRNQSSAGRMTPM